MSAPDDGPPFDDRYRDGRVIGSGSGDATPFERYVAMARDGRLDALFAELNGLEGHDGGDDGDADDLAYKLLWVAVDFGHDHAGDMIDDLLETSSLRYDDDCFHQGNAHFELGLAYLTGSDGLPPDPERARAHLLKARSCHWPEHVHEGEVLLSRARAVLSARQSAVFDEVYPAG